MIRRHLLVVLALWAAPGAAIAQDKGQVNVICSVQADWCGMIQTVFTRSTGIRVNLSMRGSAEALAQLAEYASMTVLGATGESGLSGALLGGTVAAGGVDGVVLGLVLVCARAAPATVRLRAVRAGKPSVAIFFMVYLLVANEA